MGEATDKRATAKIKRVLRSKKWEWKNMLKLLHEKEKNSKREFQFNFNEKCYSNFHRSLRSPPRAASRQISEIELSIGVGFLCAEMLIQTMDGCGTIVLNFYYDTLSIHVVCAVSHSLSKKVSLGDDRVTAETAFECRLCLQRILDVVNIKKKCVWIIPIISSE